MPRAMWEVVVRRRSISASALWLRRRRGQALDATSGTEIQGLAQWSWRKHLLLFLWKGFRDRIREL
jgi:hypothetical protein